VGIGDVMMDEAEAKAHFAALNEHLKELRPLFDAFCARHGFWYMNRQALGRYPRIRIERTRTTTIWFDLSMGLDSNGKRFEKFWRELPYDFGGGAYCVLQDNSKQVFRFGKIIDCFQNRPFDQIGSILIHEMEIHLPTLEQWDVQYLLSHGTKVPLGGSAPPRSYADQWESAAQQPFTFEEWAEYYSRGGVSRDGMVARG